MTDDELIEALSDKEHERWSRWQAYVHSLCERREDGALVIPASRVERWERQIATPYGELSQQEQDCDRREVAEIMPIIREYAAQPRSATVASQWQTCPNCNTSNYIGIGWVQDGQCPVCEGRGLVPMPPSGGTR